MSRENAHAHRGEVVGLGTLQCLESVSTLLSRPYPLPSHVDSEHADLFQRRDCEEFLQLRRKGTSVVASKLDQGLDASQGMNGVEG